MGRTVGLLCQILTPSKEIKNVLVDQSTYTDPIPGVRYFMTENGGSKQSILSEILAVCINFLFTGLVPFLICLSIIAWYSVRARCMLLLCLFSVVIFALSFLTLLIPVKVYDANVLRWKIWNCLFDYFSLYPLYLFPSLPVPSFSMTSSTASRNISMLNTPTACSFFLFFSLPERLSAVSSLASPSPTSAPSLPATPSPLPAHYSSPSTAPSSN